MGKHTGSTLDDFLDEEGLLAESEAIAVKRVIAYQLGEMMKSQGLSKLNWPDGWKQAVRRWSGCLT